MDTLTTQAADIVTISNALPSLMTQFVYDKKRADTTRKGYETCLRQFCLWMQINRVTAPTRQDVLNYLDYLDGEHFGRSGHERLTAGTRQQYTRAIRAFFDWASARGFYDNIAEDVGGVTVDNRTHKRDALTREEAMTVEDSIDRATIQGKRLYAMFLLGVRRGLRTVEISRASIKDLEEISGIMYLNIWGKGHSEPDEKRALDEDTAAAIRDYLQARGHYTLTDPLFVSTSNNSKGQRIAPTTVSTMLKHALVAAGFDSTRLTAHSLRHTAITQALKCSDKNIYTTQDFARQKNPKTTEIYTHNDVIKDDAELVQKIYNNYHDNTDTKALRQEGHELIDSLEADDLAAVVGYLRDLKLKASA